MARAIVIDANMGGIIPQEDIEARFPDEAVVASDEIKETQYADARKAFVTGNRWWDDDALDLLDAGDWGITVGAGYDAIPIDAFEARGITFSTSSGLNADQVADHAMAMALAVTRNLRTYHEHQRAHEWELEVGGMTHFADDRCAIVGLGHIGEAVAVRAKAFGMDIHGIKRDVDTYDGVADHVNGPDALTRVLSDARLAVLAVPHTPETEGMIAKEEIEALADDAILVNVARGPILDTDALLEAVDGDKIRAACLDVTDPEPLPEDHPLWAREDVFITPHVAGATDNYTELFLDHFEAQFERWIAGEDVAQRVA